MTPLILVVDDDPQIRELLVCFLTDEGYATVTASNGMEALAAVRREAPDLRLPLRACSSTCTSVGTSSRWSC